MRWIMMGMTIFIGLIVYITGLFIQMETSKGVFFGVRTPDIFLKREDFKILEKEYKKGWSVRWIISIISTIFIMFLVDKVLSAGIMLIYLLGVCVLLNLCYYKTHKKVKAIKAKEDWSEYFINDKIVVVDLKKEKQEKNYSKLFWIPIILIIISIILNVLFYISSSDNMALNINSAGVVDSWGQKGSFNTIFEKIILVPMGLTLFTAFFWGLNKVIYKAKNQINGGEVNEIIEQKRHFRKVGSWIFIICNIQIILTMTGINIMSFANKTPGLIFYLLMVLGFLIPSILVIFYSYKIGQGGANIKVKGRIDGDKLIINRDDDDNYLWGSMYCNKEDPALFVEKRIGFGWDFNLGNKKAKWFLAPIVALLLWAMFATFFLAPASIKPRIIEVDNNKITIKGSYGEDIIRSNIEKVTLEGMPNKISKTNGASIDDKHYGNYKITYKDGSVKAKLYIENAEGEVIFIETKDGKLYLINRKNVEDTKALYNKIK